MLENYALSEMRQLNNIIHELGNYKKVCIGVVAGVKVCIIMPVYYISCSMLCVFTR